MRRHSFLVQRLLLPSTGQVPGNIAFGVGIKNGELSAEGMGLMKGIWRFDDMGTPEYEEAVPSVLLGIARRAGDYVGARVKVDMDDPRKDFMEKMGDLELQLGVCRPRLRPGTRDIHVVAPASWLYEVGGRIRSWATPNPSRIERWGSSDWDTEEPVLLEKALYPVTEYEKRLAGWLELDNGFFFFVNRDMYQATCRLFGVKITDE